MEPINDIVTTPIPDYSKRIEEERAKNRPANELFIHYPYWMRVMYLRDRAELLKTGKLVIVDPTGTFTSGDCDKLINCLLDG